MTCTLLVNFFWITEWEVLADGIFYTLVTMVTKASHGFREHLMRHSEIHLSLHVAAATTLRKLSTVSCRNIHALVLLGCRMNLKR